MIVTENIKQKKYSYKQILTVKIKLYESNNFKKTGIKLTNLYSPEIVKAIIFSNNIRILLFRGRNAVFLFYFSSCFCIRGEIK